MTFIREKSKWYCYAFTSALEPLLRSSSARSNFRYHSQMQGLQLPCYPHASLGQAWYSYQLCIAISLADTVAASAAPFSFWCPFQSYFSAVVICTACDTSWLPPSVSSSVERCAMVPFTNVSSGSASWHKAIPTACYQPTFFISRNSVIMTRDIFNQDVRTRELPRALQSEIIYDLPSPSLSSILTERALLNFPLPIACPIALPTHSVTSVFATAVALTCRYPVLLI